MLFKKFMIPPMVAVPPRGAIKDGIDQPTGAVAASPLNTTEIRTIAQTVSVVKVAPNTAKPISVDVVWQGVRDRISASQVPEVA
jgi:hypothetical protein